MPGKRPRYPSDSPEYRRLKRKGVPHEEAARVAGVNILERGFTPGRGRGIFAITFARLMVHSVIDPVSRCFIWTGYQAKARSAHYGMISYRDPDSHKTRSEFIHRVSHMLFLGPIPEGFDVDHICRRHLCWNPDHIRAVTKAVNCQARELAKRRGQWLHNLTGSIDTEKYRKHGVIVARCHDNDENIKLMNDATNRVSVGEKEKARGSIARSNVTQDA